MKPFKLITLLFLGALITVTGCAKKSTDQASLSGTGFDTIATNEELSQLPQASVQSQQSAIEVLPIEPSPITQSAPALATAAETTVQTGVVPTAREIQTALKNAGLYTGSIDGKIGPGTQRAIKAFQEKNGLKVDGKVGRMTWAALSPYLNSTDTTATTGSTVTY